MGGKRSCQHKTALSDLRVARVLGPSRGEGDPQARVQSDWTPVGPTTVPSPSLWPPSGNRLTIWGLNHRTLFDAGEWS